MAAPNYIHPLTRAATDGSASAAGSREHKSVSRFDKRGRQFLTSISKNRPILTGILWCRNN